LRKLSKRDVRKILAEKGGETEKRKPKEKRAKGKRRSRKSRVAPSKKARRKR
jgi:hypothetical protein